jgi:TonB family protein
MKQVPPADSSTPRAGSPHRWLLLLLPALCTCAHKRRETPWPAPEPRDRCFAGAVPDAQLAGAQAAMSIQPKGGLKEGDVQRVFRSRAQDLKGCFAAGLSARKTLSGRVQLRFTVEEDGSVLRSEIEHSTLRFPQLEACLGRTLCRWRFAAPTTKSVTVSYPFLLSAGSPAR